MKRFTINILGIGMIVAGTLSAATVNQRRENQQDRIGQGILSGQLTAREAGNLERQQVRTNRQIFDDREDHNGHLTAREHLKVNREQNQMSREIYRDKHDAFRQ